MKKYIEGERIQDVFVDFQPNHNLSKFHTYKFRTRVQNLDLDYIKKIMDITIGEGNYSKVLKYRVL